MSYTSTFPSRDHNTGSYGNNAYPVVNSNWPLSQPTAVNTIQNPNFSENQLEYNHPQPSAVAYFPAQAAQLNSKPLHSSHMNPQSNFQTENSPKPFSGHAPIEYTYQNRYDRRGNLSGAQNIQQPWVQHQSQQVLPQYGQQGFHEQIISHQSLKQQNLSQQNVSQQNLSQQNLGHQNLNQQNLDPQNLSQQNLSQQHQQWQQYGNVNVHQQHQNRIEPQNTQSQIPPSSGSYSNQQNPQQYQQQMNVHHQNQQQCPPHIPVQQSTPQQQDIRYANQGQSSNANHMQSSHQNESSQLSSHNQWEQFGYAVPNDQNNQLYGQPSRTQPNEFNQNRNLQNHPVSSNSFAPSSQHGEQYSNINGTTCSNQIPSFQRQVSSNSDCVTQGRYTNPNDTSAQQQLKGSESLSHPRLERKFSGQSYQPANTGGINQPQVANNGFFNPGSEHGNIYHNGANISATQSKSDKQFHFKNQPQSPIHPQIIPNRPPAPLQPQCHNQPQLQDQLRQNIHPNSHFQLQNQPQGQIDSLPQSRSQFQEETQSQIRPQTSLSIAMSNQSQTPFYQTAAPARQNSQEASQVGHSSIAFANHFESGSRPSYVTNTTSGISTSGSQAIPYTVAAPRATQQLNSIGPSVMGSYMSAPLTPEAQANIPMGSSNASATRIPRLVKYPSPISGNIPFQAQCMGPQEIRPNFPQSQNGSFAPSSGMSNQQELVEQVQNLGMQNRRGSEQRTGIVRQVVKSIDESKLTNRPPFANSVHMSGSTAAYGQQHPFERAIRNPFLPQSPNANASGQRFGSNSEAVRFPAPSMDHPNNRMSDSPMQRLNSIDSSVRPVDSQRISRFVKEPQVYAGYQPPTANQATAVNSQGQQGPLGQQGQQGHQGPLGQQRYQGPLGQQGPLGLQRQQGHQGALGQQGLEQKSTQPPSLHNKYSQPFSNWAVTSGHSMVSSGHPIVIMPGYAASSSMPNHGQTQSNFEARTESILEHISDKQGPMYDKLKKVLTDVFAMQDEVSTFKGRRGDKNYIFIEEMLTRQLLSLDAVQSEGNEELRLARRSIVRQVQGLLSSLEMKAKT